jgi:hypothetical protein
MSNLEDARNVDLAEEAERLKKEAEVLRTNRRTDVDSAADTMPGADEKVEKSVETLRRLAKR